MKINKIIVFILMGWLASGCHSSRTITPAQISLMPDFCVTAHRNYADTNQLIYKNTDSLLAAETTIDMSNRDLLVANASGSLDLLNKLSGLFTDSVTRKKRYFEYTTAIEKNIALVRSEVDDVTAELECEIIRCRQLSSYLGNLNAKRNSKLTVAAIIAGSITTITPIFIKQTAAQNIVLISGGVVTAGLGLMTLNPAGKQIKLVSTNNMLSDIWFANKMSVVYPPPIWYMMNNAHFSNSGITSKRELIVARWMQFELGGPPDKQTIGLLFGNGGIFDQSSLETRAVMLTEVMSHVNSIKKDLDNFSYALNNMKVKMLDRLDW